MHYLSAMRFFIHVVDRGSLSKVAQDAGVKTSTVSRAVTTLEADLGIPLLNRSTRRMHPTEAGVNFYARAVRILDDFDAACQQVSALNSCPQGVLKVHLPRAFACRHIIPLLPEFFVRYPDIKLDALLNDMAPDVIATGIDLAIRIGALPDSTLIAKKLAPYGWMLCASPAYLSASRPIMHPRDLSQHACVLASTDRWMFTRAGEQLDMQVCGRLQVDDNEALLVAARCGLGVTLLPTWLIGEELDDGRLQPLLTEWQPRPITGTGAVWGIYAPKKAVSRKIRVFLDFIEHEFSHHSRWRRNEPEQG